MSYDDWKARVPDDDPEGEHRFDEDGACDGCWRCHGEGGWHDCGEDSCCCGINAELVNEDFFLCPECNKR